MFASLLAKFRKPGLVKVSCLGGSGEIGMNLYLYESAKHAIIVDYGVMFGTNSMPGIDNVLPDPAYLHTIKDKLRAVVFTHGHEDHIGGAAKMIEQFDLPIYTGKFTAELLRCKTERSTADIKIHECADGDSVKIGDFTVDFISVPHSIPDTFALRINHKHFAAIHASDFRTDRNAAAVAAKFAEKPVTCLFMDSTNANSGDADQHTEEEIFNELLKLFREAKGAVFFTTFASNVRRLASAVDAARVCGRKVVVEGPAMERTIGIASRMGLINLPESMLLNAGDSRKEEPSTLLYLVGGCQGEYTSALYSIAAGERKAIRMAKGDILIFSSRHIPGNEANINSIVNSAMREDVEVMQPDDNAIHASGHIPPNEAKILIEKVMPEWFIPIHGEYQHLKANSELAAAAGMADERCLLFETGDQLVFENGKFKEKTQIEHGRIYVDLAGGFEMSLDGLTERRQISTGGVVVVLLRHKENNGHEINIKTYGFSLDTSQELDIIAAIHARAEQNEFSNELVKAAVKWYFRKVMKRRPLIDVVEI